MARCFRAGGRKATARVLRLSLDALVWVESRSMGKVLEWKPEGRIQGASCGFRVIRTDLLLTADESRARQKNAGVERNQQEWCQVRYVYQKAKPLQRA